MFTLAPLALAATLATGVQPAGTIQGLAGQPVDVVACTVTAPETLSIPSYTPYAIDLPGAVTISFVNRAPQAAKQVAFTVNDGGETINLVDSGTFSNDVRITHTFAPNADLVAGPATCSVNAVNYGDGLAWQSN